MTNPTAADLKRRLENEVQFSQQMAIPPKDHSAWHLHYNCLQRMHQWGSDAIASLERTERDAQDDKDAHRVLRTFYAPVRCKGGRIIDSGKKCPHCDSYDPQNECGAAIKEGKQ